MNRQMLRIRRTVGLRCHLRDQICSTALLTASFGTTLFKVFFLRARSWFLSIECVLAVSSLPYEVVASDAILRDDGGEYGGDDMALTDRNRLKGALIEVQS